ncbi:MAG: isoaspartyl peptidase/L-asparaginase, partial [Terriglobia bacterium]
IGCGCYADQQSGAISATGYGEAIMKVVLAKAASDLLAEGLEPQAAAEQALARLTDRTAGKGGLIVLDRAGRVGTAFTTPRMAYGFRTAESPEAVIRV